MADRVDVDTSGLDRALAQLRAHLGPIASRACADTAKRVADQTRGSVPRRSGRLAASVAVDTVGDGASASMSTPYAGWIEYGGSRGRARVEDGRYLGAASRGADLILAAQAERDLQREARAW